MSAPIRFGSVCSGIEAASVAFEALGWRAAWLSEIEPFPSAVLAHHYPDVPNLGDMTTIAARVADGRVVAPDILVGGTPCQSWSVAGKRGGADDPRGQLTFSFLRIAEVAKPRFIVWENVPGILSVDKGRPFCQFLDGLLALGYVVNCDILDAQFFGLAQRRRRVFVVCQHASFLMKEKSNISVTIGAIAVLGILQNILAALHQESGSSPEKLAAKCANVRDGLERKIKCFSVQSEEILQTWLQNLAEAFLSAATDRECWGLNLGPGTKTAANSSQSVGTQLSVFQDETASRSLCLSTSQSWKSELEDLFSALKSFTTLTELKAITAQKICIYAEMLHTIGWFIAQLKESCPHSLKLESLHSTLTKEFTKYARQADEPFFRGERIFRFWDDFSSKARAASDIIASARSGFDPAAVLFESEGVRRDIAPSREAGEEAARGAARGARGGGPAVGVSPTLRAGGNKTGGDRPPGTDVDTADSLVITMAHGQGGAEIGFDRTPTLTCNHEAPIAVYAIQAGALRTNPNSGPDGIGVQANHAYTLEARAEVQAVCITGDITHTLKAEGFDASEDGTGRGTPLVPHVVADAASTLDTAFGTKQGLEGQHVNAGCPVYGIPGNWIGRQPENGGNATAPMLDISPCLTSTDRHGVAAPALVPHVVGALACNTGPNGHDAGNFACNQAVDAALQPIAFQNVADCLTAAYGTKWNGNASATNGSLFAAQPRTVGVFYAGQGAKAGSIAYSADVAPTLKASDSGTNRVPSAHIGMQVRRLTPVECERLMGFSDDYTAIPWRKKSADQCPDGPRYRALGNSWAVPVVSWIGRRIQRELAT